MEIKLRTLALENLDMNNSEHYILVRRSARDENSMKFVSKNMDNFVKQPIEESKFEDGKTYILKKDEKLIGFMGSKKLNSTGILELWCNIDGDFRSNGYATRALEEITPYLIENVDGLQDIKLRIDKYNHASKKTALKAGYNLVDVDDKIEEYRYFGGEKSK